MTIYGGALSSHVISHVTSLPVRDVDHFPLRT